VFAGYSLISLERNSSHDLPDDVVLRVSGVSKKFCRGSDCRPQTADLLGGSASGKTDTGQEVGRVEDPKSLQSAVCGLIPKVCGLLQGAQECVLERGDSGARQEGNRCAI